MTRIVPETVGGEEVLRPRSFHATFKVLLLVLVVIPLLTSCQANTSLTLALLGDLNLGRDVKAGIDSFAYLEDHLSKADLVVANLESPLGEKPGATTMGYNLCTSEDNAVLLETWGIDLLALANNHSMDCSPEGIGATQSILSAVGLVGLTSHPYQVEIKGTDITFFAFDDISAEMDLESAVESINVAHTSESLVVVSMHWGMEYQGAPSDRQKYLARVLAEAGADIIWGHHPHVLQKMEWLKTSRGHSLVLYSLGNALFDQGGLDDTRQSALLLVKLEGGIIMTVEAIPFEINVPSSTLESPSENSSEEILSRLAIPDGIITNK